MSQERRRHSRVPVAVSARAANAPADCRVVEMTVEGLTVKMSRLLKAGAECRLTLEGGFSCVGTVVHSHRAGPHVHAGLRLVDAPPVKKLKLFRYIQKRKEQPSEHR